MQEWLREFVQSKSVFNRYYKLWAYLLVLAVLMDLNKTFYEYKPNAKVHDSWLHTVASLIIATLAKFSIRLFSWPEGVTVWALFFTLFAIAEQADQARQAVEATREQVELSRRALIAQFRPKVILRWLRVIETDDFLTLDLKFANVGGTVAEIVEASVRFSWFFTHSPRSEEARTVPIAPFVLEAGADSDMSISMHEEWLLYRMSEDNAAQGRHNMFLRFRGLVVYKDQNSVRRVVSFNRLFSHSQRKFIVDPQGVDDEYSD